MYFLSNASKYESININVFIFFLFPCTGRNHQLIRNQLIVLEDSYLGVKAQGFVESSEKPVAHSQAPVAACFESLHVYGMMSTFPELEFFKKIK